MPFGLTDARSSQENERPRITAAAVFKEQDEEVLDNVLDGNYSLVFTSPESMLATKDGKKY